MHRPEVAIVAAGGLPNSFHRNLFWQGIATSGELSRSPDHLIVSVVSTAASGRTTSLSIVSNAVPLHGCPNRRQSVSMLVVSCLALPRRSRMVRAFVVIYRAMRPVPG